MVLIKSFDVLILVLFLIKSGSSSAINRNIFKQQFGVNPSQCGRRINEIRADRLNKIVGGQQADPEDWGWQVALEIGGSFRCGGSLISTEWVITAAHCIISNQISSYTIKLGLHNRVNPESYSTARKASQIIVYPSYNEESSREFDIALIKLISPVEFTDQILPICLPNNDHDFTNQMAWATGWGSLSSGGFPTSNLMEVEVPILSDSDCRVKYFESENYYINTVNSICAGRNGEGKDTCQGDSGGPLVAKVGEKWQLAGITSWGIGCGDGGVYTKTSFFINWILTQTQSSTVLQNSTTNSIQTDSKTSSVLNSQSVDSSLNYASNTSSNPNNQNLTIIKQIIQFIIGFLNFFQNF